MFVSTFEYFHFILFHFSVCLFIYLFIHIFGFSLSRCNNLFYIYLFVYSILIPYSCYNSTIFFLYKPLLYNNNFYIFKN